MLIEEVISAPEGFERNDLFIQEMQHFINLGKGLEDSRCSLDDGIKALELCLKAKEAESK